MAVACAYANGLGIKRLEIMSHQGIQLLPMSRGNLCQTTIDRSTEILECIVMLPVQHLLLDELPQPLNQVQVGRVRWQELQMDVQTRGQFHHQGDRKSTRL